MSSKAVPQNTGRRMLDTDNLTGSYGSCNDQQVEKGSNGSRGYELRESRRKPQETIAEHCAGRDVSGSVW